MPVDGSDALALLGPESRPKSKARADDEPQPQPQQQQHHWRLDSFISAVARTVIASMAFLFKRPIRIFRPVRFSTFTIIDLMAKQEGKRLGVRYIQRLIRRERPMFLLSLVAPPLLANTAIGFTLFQTYTSVERMLQPDPPQYRALLPGAFTPLGVVAAAGAAAGAAQCIISAPLENVRTVIQQYLVREVDADARHARRGRPAFPWASISRAALMPFLPEPLYRRVTKSVARSHGAILGTRTSAAPLVHSLTRRVHGAGLTLSVARDSLGFSAFFVLFEVTRRIALHTSLMLDRVTPGRAAAAAPHAPREWDSELDVSYNTSRTVHGRVAAALILVSGGALGALIYELIGRPFDLMHTVLHDCLRHVRRADAETAQCGGSHKSRSSARFVRSPVLRVSRWQETTPLVEATRLFPSSASRTRHRAGVQRKEVPRATAQLMRYALRTARPGEVADPVRMLFQTYVVRPYLHPERCPRRLVRLWKPDYAPQNAHRGPPAPVRLRSAAPSNARWLLGRLLSPYGCAFLMFAWMGGDLA